MFWLACKLEETSGTERGGGREGGGREVGRAGWVCIGQGAPMRGGGCHRLSQWAAVSR